METKIHPCLTYGKQHSRSYVPSILAPFLVDRDDKGRVVKQHSDVHLLLHQQNLQKKIGVDAIRNYLDKLHRDPTPRPDLSDDELFSLIEPKEVNNLTDAWKFAKYLQGNSDKVRTKYDDLCAKAKKISAINKKYNLNE